MTKSELLVGMADIHFCKGPAKYTCLGLGSCIGLALVDNRTQISGMIHIMLPATFPDRPVDKIGKFADVGIPELIRVMSLHGAEPRRMVAAYCGGAAVFKTDGVGSHLDIGARNADAVKKFLNENRIPVCGVDVGGSSGRTMIYHSDSGEITVRTVLGGERTLCNLKAG
ncbi:MAG: chemotaxis protein CheD [Chthonomonas sp.]|nr:chemotaxis protein CheD [Chthonomonas sp.]